jgi:hypothetical protein
MKERDRVFDAETKAFLESGCALIFGTVSTDGEPHVNRGWGFNVSADSRHRLLISAHDETARAYIDATGRIAITATSVLTLHSLQLKGLVVSIEVATADDEARAARYCDAFAGDIFEVDGTPRTYIDRVVPSDYLALTVEIEETFDQTPGPAAGTPLAGSTT